jgi:DNA-directed RNA polymerase sigma subunit (sigma70/sigma32)
MTGMKDDAMFADPTSGFGAGSISDFVHEASSAPLPDAGEERRLAEAARGGDRQALDLLVQTHLRLVVDVAIALRGDVPATRLISAGISALVEAAEQFDPARHESLRSFARPLIRRRMRDVLFPELAHHG